MKYKKRMSVCLITLIISLVSIEANQVLATRREDYVLIQSIYGSNEGIFSDKGLEYNDKYMEFIENTNASILDDGEFR